MTNNEAIDYALHALRQKCGKMEKLRDKEERRHGFTIIYSGYCDVANQNREALDVLKTLKQE